MIALQCHSHFPNFLNLSPPPSSSSSHTIKPLISPIFGTKPSVSDQFHKTRNQTTLRRSKFNDGVNPEQDSSFFDENGAVEDMDSYLNHLSLEYDSVWDTKPSWCQPWTIGLTGIGIITGSWLVLNSIVVTAIVATLICLWWYIFLYSYPKAYSDMIDERRKKVTSGQEDTYGLEDDEPGSFFWCPFCDCFWRRALASASRFSSSRRRWMRFCSISERLKNFLPPASSARLCLFFSSSCFRISMIWVRSGSHSGGVGEGIGDKMAVLGFASISTHGGEEVRRIEL
ncbi:hypothetical protein PHJA_000342400 [Phtheirospermum japonicum]|uniref:DUF6737 domain-containing protein n=1 Tax=Phtheirospermum japonicum TaxID=374723 RepID=A0A830BIT7_9LAMI|nr:hypothetical protein PHJA_000342400 [Phtheirospermum japonicum]